MAHMKVYQKYMGKLIKVLPMDDVLFTTNLTTHDILPDEIDAHIKSLPTPAVKAEYFLKNVIKKSLDIDEIKEFESLITVMEKCGYPYVERFAEKMKSDLDEELKAKRKHQKREESSDNESGNDNNDEKVFSNSDGRSYIDERVREEKKNAVCIVYPPVDAGTGFIGRMELLGEDSVVLVTNYHVIISGLSESYEKAKEVSEDMKEKILTNARRSDIEVEGKKIKLSGGMLVESSCKMSSRTSLDYFIIKLDEAKLTKELPNGIPTINLNCPADVKNNDLISIFQHPRTGPISSSSSNCRIVESRKGDRAQLMVYRGGTDPGSSGGPIFKVVKKDLVIVGLHRGGYIDNWDEKGATGYNYGTCFSDIIKSVQENWHPTVPNHEDENDKKDIYRVVKDLK